MLMIVFGVLPAEILELLLKIRAETGGLIIGRRNPRRSDTPFPTSNDLEQHLVPFLARHAFQHHTEIRHRRTGERFEYDFFHSRLGVAIEVMGYRADDEIYKDLLKFHVHEDTRVGVVWVPRWKWISGKATETNYRAALKALAFADSFMRVDALVAFPYDWSPTTAGTWSLVHVSEGDAHSSVA